MVCRLGIKLGRRRNFRVANHSPEARERYFKRYTTVVSVLAGSGVGSPYISHECPADSLLFVAIQVDGYGSLATLRFGRIHLARSFECARDLDTEVAQYRCARLCRVMVEKNVVAIIPQASLAANELPDLVQGRPPRGANRARRDLAPHSG